MLIPDKSNNKKGEELELKLFRRAGESLSLTIQQMDALEQTCHDDRIQFYLFATQDLIQDLVAANDEILNALPSGVVSSLLEDKGILFNQDILIKHAKGELDEHNAYLLKRCDIKYTHYLPAVLLNRS